MLQKGGVSTPKSESQGKAGFVAKISCMGSLGTYIIILILLVVIRAY